MSKPRVFLDTSALIAGVLSATGGARALLQLGELGLVELWVGRRVLEEADRFFQRKSPQNRALFARLLDVTQVQIAKEPGEAELRTAQGALEYAPDAFVLAEALVSGADYLVSHDKEHFLANADLNGLPSMILTPGECLAIVRAAL